MITNGKADLVRSEARGRWLEILTDAGLPPECLDGRNHPCPKCGGTDRFAAFRDVADTGGTICRKCHAKQNGDGFATIQWYRGCTFPEAIGFVSRTLGIGHNDLPRNGNRGITATYPYRDEAGELLFQVVRYDPKDFRQRKPKPDGGWDWSVKGTRVVLYQLPELSANPDSVVFVPEGEKDCDNLAGIGVLATCNACGAGKWTPEHSEFLRGRRVVVLPDNDETGRNHAQQVAQSLQGIAESVRVVELTGLPEKGDVSDWIAAGGTREQLEELVGASPEWTPVNDGVDITGIVNQGGGEASQPRLEPIPYHQFVLDHPRLRRVVVDGLLREGETLNVIAASKAGKTWLSMDLGMSIATGSAWLGNFATNRGRVLLVDNELHPQTLASRLLTLRTARGHDLASLADSLHVVTLRGQGVDLLQLKSRMEGIEPGRYSAIILDALYRFVPDGTSENDNAQMMALYNVMDQMADRLRCAFISIHHASKGQQGTKSVVDVGSGAGSMSRAADTHLVIRPHEQPGYAVLEAAVRSFPPVPPLSVYYSYPCWEPSEVQAVVGVPKSAGERRQATTDQETREKLLEALAEGRRLSSGQLRGLTGFSAGRVSRGLSQLRDDDTVLAKTFKRKKTGKRTEVYYIASDAHE